MSSNWNDIHRTLVRSSSTLTFLRTFATMLKEHPALAGFADPTALLGHLHHGGGSFEEKNDLLAALVDIAQSGSAAADVAVTVLLLALWPGLDAVHHRLSRRARAGDDLASEILAQAVEAVRRLDRRKVRRIAATILMNIERDVGRAATRERRRQSLAVDLDIAVLADDRGSGHPEALDLLLRREVARHAGEDSHLVVSVAIDGYSQTEMAVTLGLSEAAARKRYQRAIRRLRTVFSDDLSRSGAQPGFFSSGVPAPHEKEGTGLMTPIDDAEDLTRMPGLFRRWEFSDVLEPRRIYRLEEAGAHADGTPLVAIYAGPGAEKDVDRRDAGDHGPRTGGA